jgi:hypothetical protein
VKNAMQAWDACMARNGYHVTDPQTAARNEMSSVLGGGRHINAGQQISSSANEAQIAMAVTDADCTQSSDLAGIYFAVQASYEQQIVSANQQALATAVQQYRAAYAGELRKLSSLLKTTRAQPLNKPQVVGGGKPKSSPSG